jgi:hypothetical protein
VRKQFELTDPESCLNRSQNNEMIFILRGHDVAAPGVIRGWVMLRIAMGKNKLEDKQIQEALSCAAIMERER